MHLGSVTLANIHPQHRAYTARSLRRRAARINRAWPLRLTADRAAAGQFQRKIVLGKHRLKSSLETRSYSVWRRCFTFFETVEDGRVHSRFKKRTRLAKGNTSAFPGGSLISAFLKILHISKVKCSMRRGCGPVRPQCRSRPAQGLRGSEKSARRAAPRLCRFADAQGR